MYATLGSISFQVLASPRKFEAAKKYKYEPIYVIGAAPVLQWIYDDLRHIDLTIFLHQLWLTPQDALDALEQLADTHEAQPLVFGNGQNIGNFVISEMRLRHIWQAVDGTPIAVEVDIALTEDVDPQATSTSNVATTAGASANPPGLSTSQTSPSSPGTTLVQSPATASPSGIPVQAPYTNIPPSTIARGY
jgi:phage protein U